MLKLSILPGGTLQPVVIFDETVNPPSWCLDGFNPEQSVLTQTSPVWRAPFQFIAPRYNTLSQWKLRIDRTFPTELAAQTFKANYAATVPFSGELQLTIAAAGGMAILYCKNAVRSGITFPAPSGQNRVITAMTWTLAALWSTAP